MDRHTAIKAAKKMAADLGEGSRAFAILANDGTYYVDKCKPAIGNVNGTHDVIECDWDGRTYPS